uniref:Uncharacterized protein n=1 Tax=viral metagenome TaxID=1070528 RepID=A0A6M3JDU9_9ZZZZ
MTVGRLISNPTSIDDDWPVPLVRSECGREIYPLPDMDHEPEPDIYDDMCQGDGFGVFDGDLYSWGE